MTTKRAVILVEGDSDRIALETLATRLGHDLAEEDVDIVPMNGVANLRSHLQQLEANHSVVVVCDDRESPSVRRAVARAEMMNVRIEVCVGDLEDELIRAVGAAEVEQVIEMEGELGSFRALQQMPAHRGHATEEQLRRFVGTKSGRKAKYARLLVNAVDLPRVPAPLNRALLAAFSSSSAT
jgi:predicted ATP-dependent endonuclease of OLD family